MSGITKKAAQHILDEDMKKIQPYIEQLTRITKKYQEIYDLLQEKQQILLDDDSISSEDLVKMTEPLCRGLSYYDRDFKAKVRGYTDETSMSVELLIRETAYLADNIVNRTVANRKKMLISARASELKQMFKKGTMICIDEVLAKENAAYDIGVLFQRKAHVVQIWPDANRHTYAYNAYSSKNYRSDPNFTPPSNAFDVGELDDQGRKTYKVPVSPSYVHICDSRYEPQRLSPTETALVVDTSTSKSYVKVITSNPVREVWLRRIGLLVAK